MEFSNVGHGKSWKSHGILQLLRCMRPDIALKCKKPLTLLFVLYNTQFATDIMHLFQNDVTLVQKQLPSLISD